MEFSRIYNLKFVNFFNYINLDELPVATNDNFTGWSLKIVNYKILVIFPINCLENYAKIKIKLRNFYFFPNIFYISFGIIHLFLKSKFATRNNLMA